MDTDFFAVRLRAGDVLGASVKGSATYLTVYDTTPREVHGSNQDASFIYPMDSPLPGGGNAVTDYVATRTGWHYVGVTGGSGRTTSPSRATARCSRGRGRCRRCTWTSTGRGRNRRRLRRPG